ncbi:MAG: hypothetical protein GEV06_12705 [Luteitalea sp.]|nr:hypothetical protein [Luteitalea sp.]
MASGLLALTPTMPSVHHIVPVCLALLLFLAAPSHAQDLASAVTQGDLLFDTRLRYERAEEDNDLEDAYATTLRLRLGYATGRWRGFDALAHYEVVVALGGDHTYNSGPAFLDSTNGRTTRTTIADPTGNALDQVWLRYQGLAGTAITLGRQRITLDNHRFIGDVGWRQDDQTFDAATVVNTLLPATTLTYAYLRGQRFIFFNDNGLNAHVLHARHEGIPHLTLIGYVHLIDFDNDTDPRAPGTPDHRNLGLRSELRLERAGLNLEYADQSGHADAPATVDAEYWLAEAWAMLGPVTGTVGYEVLGGNGRYGFSTPLATNHKFQGFADVFLSTPPAGVRDAYVTLAGNLARFQLTATYHDFSAEEGRGQYGDEIDLVVARPLNDRFSVLVKYAEYRAKEFAVDTRRLWLQADYRF